MKYQPYPKYKDSGVEWIGEIPEGWDASKLSFCMESQSGATPSKDRNDYWDGDVPWVSPKDMKISVIYDSEDHVTSSAVEQTSLRLVPVRSVLVVVRGMILAHTFPVAIVGRELTINQDMKALIPNHRIRSEFLSVYLSGIEAQVLSYFTDEAAHGTLAIRMDRFSKLPVLLPQSAEQLAITDFLTRETTKIDALVREYEDLIALLTEKRHALISHAVTRGLSELVTADDAEFGEWARPVPFVDSGVDWLGEIPEGWKTPSIGRVTQKITNGYVGPTRDLFVTQGVGYLQSLHIKNNKIIFREPYWVSEAWNQLHSKSILAEGDVLVVQTGDIGQTAVVTPEFVGFNCHALIILQPIATSVVGEFVSWFLNSAFGQAFLQSIGTGALHPHLNCGDIKYMPLAASPVLEQSAIAAFLTRETTKIDTLVRETRDAITLLKEHRSALITAAVTGKINVENEV